MPNGELPRAGLRLVVERLQRFLADLGKGRKGLRDFKKETKDTADATTRDMKRAGKGIRDPLRESFAEMEKIGKGIRDLGGELTYLKDGLWELKVPTDANRESFQGFVAAIEATGDSVEVTGGKVEKTTGTWATFMKQMARMGTLRGGLMFRMLSAFGGLGTAMAVGGFVAVKLGKAIGKMVNDIVDSIAELEKTQAAERAFKSLSRQAGLSMDSIVKDVEKATGFTMDKYEILTRGNKQLQQGFGDIADAMPQLAGAARALGSALGEDTAGMLDTLIDAIREGDAALLESELGFRGVSDALRAEARELGINTDDLNENTAANVALEAVLDDLERVIRSVGGAVVEVAGPMRNYLTTLEGIYKTTRDLVAFGVMDIAGIGPADLEAVKTTSKLLEGMALLNLQLQAGAEAGIIPIEAVTEALREYDRIRLSTDPLLGLMPGFDVPGVEEFQDWMDRATELLYGPTPRAARVDYMGREAAQNYFQEMQKAQEMVEDLITDWTVDFAEVMPLDDAKAQAERIGATLTNRLEEAIRETGSIASVEAQVVINDIMRLVDVLFDHIASRAQGVAVDLISPWMEFEKQRDKLMEGQTKKAERLALQLAKFLPYEDVKAFADAIDKDLQAWAEEWALAPGTLRAQYALAQRTRAAEEVVKALRDAHKETKATATSMKRLANQALLLNQNLGEWAIASTIEHGGRTPLEQYQRHEEPLVAAMIDKLWAEDFERREGRPPNQAEWDYHWNEFWGPLEAWPGGPIAAAAGPESQRAKAILKGLGITEYGDIFKREWDKRKGLLGLMETEFTQQEKINEAMGIFYGHIDKINEALKPPKPPGDGENGENGAVTIGKEVGKEIAVVLQHLPEFQGGGITRTGGLAMLHANEAILPLGDPSRAAAIFAQVLNRGFRMPAGGGGGVNIGTLSIPVTVSGAGAASPAAIQNAVVGAVRGRAGTELRRAGRRLGQ